MTQEVVTRIKLDTSSIPGAAAQASRAIGGIASSAQVSVGQTRNAIRQLPAQFTDIATQLAGGQSIGLVLLQQGGQIRDAFGSIGGALRGIASFITPLNVAFGATAAALGLVTAAYRAASQEQDAITRGLVLSGNAAGVTAGQINDLARAQDALVGTRGQAAQVLTQLASSGRVFGQQLSAAAEASVRLSVVGGPAIEDTARKFIDLGKAPLQALARINAEENIFTESVVRQVAELTRQGRAAEAAAVAQQAYADAINGRADQLEGSLGSLQRAWNAVAGGAREAWDAMLNIGRPQTLTQQLDTIARQIEANARRTDRADSFDGASGRVREGADAQLARLRQRQAELQELIRLEARGAQVQRTSAEAARQALEEEQQAKERARRADEADAARARQFSQQAQAAFRVEQAMQRAMQQARDDFDRQAERGLQQGLEASQADVLAAALGPVERNAQLQQFLDSLVVANRRANIDLISDDQERARATIELDRELLQRRIEAVYQFGEDRTQAELAADEARDLALKQLAARRVKTVEDFIGSALTAGMEGRFDDIGRQWERLLLQMAAKAAAADLANALFGIGQGGNLGNLFGTVLGLFTGTGRAGGGQVNPNSAYLVGEQGPEVLLMGGRGGTIVPNAQLSGGGRGSFAPVTNVHIDARTDAAQVAQVAGQAVRTAQEGMWQQLRSRGLV